MMVAKFVQFVYACYDLAHPIPALLYWCLLICEIML